MFFSFQNPRLSGDGKQLVAIPSDPDRSCKVSCQDASKPYRYYVVSSQDGYLPSGTPCTGLLSKNSSYCVMGKCLEFGDDQTPKYQLNSETFAGIRDAMLQPRAIRFRRELHVEPPIRVSIDQEYLEHLVDQA